MESREHEPDRPERGATAPADGPSLGVPRLGPEEARRALGRGEFERVLEASRAALATASGAEAALWSALREEALAVVRERCLGAGGSADARWLGLLVRHDPRAADSVHLAWRAPRRAPSGADPTDGRGAAAGAEGDARVPTLSGPGRRFRLTVDEAGVFLCTVADRLTLGGPEAGPGAALLRRVAALRGGHSWRLEPGASGIAVDGRPVGAEGLALHGGELLALPAAADGPPERLRLTLGPEGGCARLDLDAGRPDGAVGSLLLLAPGRDGRVWIGDRGRALVRTPALPEALELWLEESGLRLRGRGPLVLRRPDGPGAERRLAAGRAVEVPWPLVEALDVLAPAAEPGRPPFWMRLEPAAGADDRSSGGAAEPA